MAGKQVKEVTVHVLLDASDRLESSGAGTDNAGLCTSDPGHHLRAWPREGRRTYRNHGMAACACSAFWYGTLQQISNLLRVFFSTLVQCYLLPLCTGCKSSVTNSWLAFETALPSRNSSLRRTLQPTFNTSGAAEEDGNPWRWERGWLSWKHVQIYKILIKIFMLKSIFSNF